MNKKIKGTILLILIFIMVVVTLYLISIKLNNPDMTDMRLLITFWKEYLFSTSVIILDYLGITKICKD